MQDMSVNTSDVHSYVIFITQSHFYFMDTVVNKFGLVASDSCKFLWVETVSVVLNGGLCFRSASKTTHEFYKCFSDIFLANGLLKSSLILRDMKNNCTFDH